MYMFVVFSLDMNMKDEVNKKAFDRFAQSHKATPVAEQHVASERFDCTSDIHIAIFFYEIDF